MMGSCPPKTTNNTPDVPMKVPVWAENFQIKYLNPIISPLAKHDARNGDHQAPRPEFGRRLRDGGDAPPQGDTIVILLIHGKTNWVKNILAAGEADIHVRGQDLHLVNLRVIPRAPTSRACRGWRAASCAGAWGVRRRHRLSGYMSRPTTYPDRRREPAPSGERPTAR